MSNKPDIACHLRFYGIEMPNIVIFLNKFYIHKKSTVRMYTLAQIMVISGVKGAIIPNMKAKNWLQKLRQNEGKILLIIVGILIAYPFLRLTVYATFNLPDDADDAMVLVKKYDSAIFCELPWTFPLVPLPGASTQDKQDICYRNAANYFDDVELCDKVDEGELRGLCQATFIPCGEIENDDARQTCYGHFAEKGEIGLAECEDEKRVLSKAYCLEGLAQHTLEVKYCNLITDSPEIGGVKDLCYYYIAKQHMDSDICEHIQDKDYIRICKKEILEETHRQ